MGITHKSIHCVLFSRCVYSSSIPPGQWLKLRRMMTVVDQYLLWAEAIIKQQDMARPHVWSLLGSIVDEVMAARAPAVSYRLEMFGSRAFEPAPGGYCLPSSDFDIVCKLTENVYDSQMRSPKHLLPMVLDRPTRGL